MSTDDSKKKLADELPPSASGSVDVSLSDPGIPEAVPGSDSQRFDSVPVGRSGKVAVVAATEGTGPNRSRKVTGLMQDAASVGVEKLGTTIATVGGGVAKVGDLTKKVPLVGTSVGKLGEGLTKAGESIQSLPRVAQTRRGRLLVRSVVVGFLLVASWITVIVGVQLRTHDTPDFRPAAERILIEISEGSAAIGEVYERASPRFQEFVRKERFIDDMTDLNATNGKFREITSINETLVTNGPSGRVGRVSLTAAYDKGIAKGSISFHLDKGQWKLLGIGVEVPTDVKITQVERQKRVAACIDDKGHDVSDQRAKCPVRDAAETILEQIRDGKAGEVWDAASDVFKQQESRARFIQIQEEHRAALGNYKRLLTVTEARAIGGVTATFDMLAEFDKSNGVRVDFGFARASKSAPWELRRFKVVVPMPRAEDDAARPPTEPPPPAVPGTEPMPPPTTPAPRMPK
ncbi:MAG: hypothetical protein HOV81_11300 [Kofleriaceae bacterium]|nr:hypothetical protein [Kofleriaceae bacterium]